MNHRLVAPGRWLNAFVSCLLMLSLLTVTLPQATAAQTSSVVSQFAGVTVAWQPPYTLDDELTSTGPDGDIFTLSGDVDFVSIGFLPSLISLNDARTVVLEELLGAFSSFYTVDRGDYEGVSYSLDLVNVDGTEITAFSLFLGNRSHGAVEFYLYLSLPITFGSGMQTAQQKITINGSAIFNGIDAARMGEMAVANSGKSGGVASQNTDVPVVSPSTSQTDTPAPGAETPPTSAASTDDASVQQYLQTVRSFRDGFQASLERFNQALTAFIDGDSNDPARQTYAKQILEESTYWASFCETPAGFAAPVGYESVHSAFADFCSSVSYLGSLWLSVLQGNPMDTVAQGEAMDRLAISMTALDNAITAAENASVPPEPSVDTPVGGEQVDPDADSNSRRVDPSQVGRRGSSSGPSAPDAPGAPTTIPAGERTSADLVATNTVVSWSYGLDYWIGPDVAIQANPEDNLDVVWLVTADQPLSGKPLIQIEVLQTHTGSSEWLVQEFLNNPELLQQSYGSQAQIVDSTLTHDASALLVYDGEDPPHLAYIQVTCVTPGCDVSAMLNLYLPVAEGIDAMLAMETAVLQVNGLNVFGEITATDAAALLGD